MKYINILFARRCISIIFTLVMLMVLFCTIQAEGKSNPKRNIADTTVENKASQMVAAAFPGGSQAWMMYLMKNLRYPSDAWAHHIQGSVVVQFVVNEKGRLSSFQANGPAELQKEAIRVVRESGRWNPALENDVPVKSQKIQPISFKLDIPETTPNPAHLETLGSDSADSSSVEGSYPGGPSAWVRFLNRNFRYPVEAQRGNVQGTVIVQFEIDVNGKTRNFQVIEGSENEKLRDEAVRVLKLSGKWLPAKKNGIPLTSYKKQSLTFRIE